MGPYPQRQRISTTAQSEELYRNLDRRFRGPLMAYFLRRGCDHAEAEDLTQQVFCGLIRTNSSGASENYEAYIFQSAKNYLLTRARRLLARGGAHVELEESEAGYCPLTVIDGCTPEQHLDSKEMLQEVLESLAKLGERTLDMFILFRLEGMKQKQIAELYGCSPSTVEKHVAKATALLVRRYGLR